MRREGACPCGAVRFVVDGPVRDVIVCHCKACLEATGGPWAASAARRGDLTVLDPATVLWAQAAVSEHSASRGRCRTCRTVVFWDAPERTTVSFAAALLEDGGQLDVAAHIWVGEEERRALGTTGLPVSAEGLPAAVEVAWRGRAPATG